LTEINRVPHEGGELWMNTTTSSNVNNVYTFDPAWVTAAVNSLKVQGARLDKTTKEAKLTFKNEQNQDVGSLYVENGILKFKGDFDESAREFLRTINMGWQEEIQTSKEVSALNERARCLEIIDKWAENPYALVTELVKAIKGGEG
jgi:hypothetical protein